MATPFRTDQDDMPQNLSPFNAIPPVVIVFAALIVGIELVFVLASTGLIGGQGGIGWRLFAFEQYAFSSRVFDLVVQSGQTSWNLMRRFVTYIFLHAGFLQALFVAAMVLAMGKFLGDRWRQTSIVVLILACTIGGACVYALAVDEAFPLFSATTPVYGMIGGFTYTRWLELKLTGENQWRAFRLIAMLMGIQLFYGIFFGVSPQWIAELSGFFIGIGVSPVLAPGGWSAFIARLRQRSS